MNQKSEEKSSAILKIFNYVGGALIFFGVTYFIGSNWYNLSDFIKVFVSLGTAIAGFIVGILFQHAKKYTASTAFYLLAGLLFPIGLYITYQVYQIPIQPSCLDLVISTICLIVFLVSQLRSPRIIFLLFSILYASYFYFSIIEFLLYGNTVHIQNLNQYELIALGFSYIFLGYYLNFSSSSVLTGPLYFFGALLILASTYVLGVSNDTRFIFHWRIIALISIILAFILAVPLKAKSFLYLGALFLIIYIVDMSFRFAQVFGDMGWSLILVIAGLLLMLIGYLVFFLYRKISRIKFD
jgi:uncharacterized membrane protein